MTTTKNEDSLRTAMLVVPSPNILDPKFNYTPAAKTDVRETWRKFGWKPLEERTLETQSCT